MEQSKIRLKREKIDKEELKETKIIGGHVSSTYPPIILYKKGLFINPNAIGFQFSSQF